jgi:hypothetical protein
MDFGSVCKMVYLKGGIIVIVKNPIGEKGSEIVEFKVTIQDGVAEIDNETIIVTGKVYSLAVSPQ